MQQELKEVCIFVCLCLDVWVCGFGKNVTAARMKVQNGLGNNLSLVELKMGSLTYPRVEHVINAASLYFRQQ